jgi:hypothetical protein
LEQRAYASTKKVWPLSAEEFRIHVDRTLGSNRDYRHFGGDTLARYVKLEGEGQSGCLFDPSETD